MDAGIEPGGKALVDRVKAIILKPGETWPKIAGETTGQGDILKSYVLPLAAIGPVAALIGGQVFGYDALGLSYRPPIIGAVVTALVSFALAIAAVYILTLIADFLAPKFGGESNRASAFKMVAYGSTAAWLSGIFGLIPSLGFFGLLGLYSIYLYYTGAAPLMKVPEDKSAGYTAVTILCAILLMIIIIPITAAITGLFGGGIAEMTDNSDAGGKLTLPGGGTIDMGEVEKLGKQAEDAASGKSPTVEAAKLQELLPDAINGYSRTETSSGSVGQLGSTAEGRYESGDKRIILKIVDMSALGAIAGMGAAMGVEQNREDADSYEKAGVVDGQMRMEEWNSTSSNGRYAVTIASRFMVEAQGNPGSVDELKAAVAQVDPDDLTDLVD